MADQDEWKNFEDYEDDFGDNEGVLKEVTNQKLYLILGVTCTLTIGFIVIVYFICRHFGFPLVWGDLVLSVRRQMSELQAWITGEEVTPVFQPREIVEMSTISKLSTREDSNDKSYSTIGNMRSYSWPLEGNNQNSRDESSSQASIV